VIVVNVVNVVVQQLGSRFLVIHIDRSILTHFLANIETAAVGEDIFASLNAELNALEEMADAFRLNK
jgi:hydroxyethylthiazole kinase-like sugar kinase family protein